MSGSIADQRPVLQNRLRNGAVAPQFIQNRSANTLISKRGERCAPSRIELTGRFNQAEDAGRLQIVAVNSLRQSTQHLAQDMAHEIQMLKDQTIPEIHFADLVIGFYSGMHASTHNDNVISRWRLLGY